MSDPILPLAVWEEGTLQNDVPANDNALRVEAMHRPVLGIEDSPTSTNDGDVFIVGASPSGDFATFSPDDLAIYRGGNWYAWSPADGMQINGYVYESGTGWVPVSGSGTVTSVGLTLDASISDLFSVAGSPVTGAGAITLSGDDPGSDMIAFWDDSASKWTFLTVGSGLTITGTTLSATGGGGTGDVVGPASAVADRIATYDGTTGKLIKDGGKTIADLRSPAIQSVTSSSTVTPTFSDDMVKITAQAAALALANPTGTPIPGLGMVIRIKDNGTAREISYGTQYRAIGVTLPTTTVVNKTLYLAMIYNSDDAKWDVLVVRQEA